MIDLNLIILIITLNTIDLILQSQNLSDWIKKQEPPMCWLQEMCFKYKDRIRLKVKGYKKTYQKKLH